MSVCQVMLIINEILDFNLVLQDNLCHYFIPYDRMKNR